MKIKNPKHGRKIEQLFKDAFMFERHPWLIPIFGSVEMFDDWSLVESTLRDHPNLYPDAKKYKAQTLIWIDDNAFFPHPYKKEELETIRGTYCLGHVNFENSEAGLNPIDFTRGLFICGEPGGGKTYATLSLVDQMLQVPKEERGFNIIIIQVVKRDADFLIRSYPSLRIIEYDNLRYNIWHTEGWDETKIKHNYSVNIFSKVNWLGPLTQPILQTSLDLCLENNFKPTFSKINRMIMPAVSALQLGGLDVRNQSDRVKQRLSEFQKTENIFDGLSHYPVQGFWDTEDIVLNLMQEPNSYIYQTVITDLLTTMQRLYEHNEAKNDLRTLVVIDECGSVFPLTGKDIDTDRFMERLIKSCRACGIGRINITQQPHKVADYVPDNSAYFLTFPIAGTAIDPIKKYIMLSDEQVSHIQKLEKYGEGIFRDRRFDRPYIIQVPPYLDDSPILRSEVNAMMQPYIENLIQKYTQKPEPVRAKSEIYSEAQLEYYRKKIWSHTRAVLEKLYSEPFLNHTKIQTVMDISRSKFKKSIEWLEGHRLLKTIKCKTSKTREATFYPLTVDGFRLLEIPEKDRKNGAHMFKHDYYKMRLFECLKAMKLSPAMEYLPDNLKTMGAHGRIDVYCKSKKGKQYANEITLSFSNLIDNVKKCDLADMDVISIICEDQAGIDKAKAKIEDAHIRTRAEIKYKKINEYL